MNFGGEDVEVSLIEPRWSIPVLGKLQITPLKFGNALILYPEISKFEFYLLKFGDV